MFDPTTRSRREQVSRAGGIGVRALGAFWCGVSQRVRKATLADVPAIAAIYRHAVPNGAPTFDVADPPPSYWQAKLSSTALGDRVVVVEDASTVVVGYACSTASRPRLAYAGTRETSIYLAPEGVGKGLRRLTYSHLLSLLREDEVHLRGGRRSPTPSCLRGAQRVPRVRTDRCLARGRP
jgi:L-amino acid N-acyltransferase YncA